MQDAKAKLRELVRNVFTGGMFDRYDAETTRRVVMVNILIFVGFVLLVAYSTRAFYIGAYRIAIPDFLAAVLLLLAGLHVRYTHTYLFASNVSVSVFGLFFLYLAVDGGVDNTGHLWAFVFPLLAVIHFGLRKGTIAIGLFLAGIIFFFVIDFRLVANEYSLDFKFRFVSSLLTIGIFAYLHEYIRVANLEEIVRHNEELAKAQRLQSLGLLAGGIAHDFNNILTGVLGNLGLLEMSVPRHSNHHRLVMAAKKAADQSIGLAQQLLTFSEGGSPVKEPAAMESLLRETTELSLRGSKVRPDYDFQKDLFPVEIDKAQMAQVIQNVVINADHAMPDGGFLKISAANVSVRDGDQSMDPGAYVKISIEDKGVGIPEDVVPKIFDLYFTTKTEGHGLGLAVSHSIVSKHSGHITVSSNVGVGTRFDIYIPASVKAPAPMERTEKKIQKGEGRILLMDDDDIIQDTVGRILEKLGYQVHGVADGVEALEAYRAAMEAEQPYDLVILDLTIPGGMGGKETVSRLRKLHPGARVIVSSGYSNDPVMANHRDYGFDAVVLKPVDIPDLAETVRQVLAG